MKVAFWQHASAAIKKSGTEFLVLNGHPTDLTHKRHRGRLALQVIPLCNGHGAVPECFADLADVHTGLEQRRREQQKLSAVSSRLRLPVNPRGPAAL